MLNSIKELIINLYFKFNTMTLIDGNSNFYPLIEISGSNVLKDPQWKNLFQIKCFSQCILTNLDNDSVGPKVLIIF